MHEKKHQKTIQLLKSKKYFSICILFLILSTILHGQNVKDELYGMGNNGQGQIGIGSTPSRVYSLTKVGTATDWLFISAGRYHTLAINTSGELYGWGLNSTGQLGDGTTNDHNTPTKIGSSSDWIAVSAGWFQSFAINTSGELFSWGNNEYGQLGDGTTVNKTTPAKVGTSNNWLFIYSANNHTLAINKNGELYTWGSNSYGQLGDGTTTAIYIPTKIGSAKNWVSTSGWYHSVAINSNGELYTWGRNSYGQLGDGTTTDKNTPQKIGAAKNWTKTTTGFGSTYAINKEGELHTWGFNYDGQLGDATTTNKTTPTKIASSNFWIDIEASERHAIAINSDFELFTWGNNNLGQLGDGTWIRRTVPNKIITSNKPLKIAAGHEFSLAIIQDRQPFIWTGTANFNSSNNWSLNSIPTKVDSIVIKNGTLTINQSTTLDIMTVLGGSTVKLEAPLTLRNLHLKNGTIDLNGHKLTVTGRVYQSTDSTNYYIQAGTSAVPKPRSELAIKPTTAVNSTLYFNPSANRLNKLEIGNGTAAAQITLANAVKIKGGEDGGTGPGLLTVNKNAKIIIATGSSLTLESDTFNAGLSLAQPAHRSIVCQGTGKFNIERDHFGARAWRLYAHPFNTDIDLQEVANDIELIGSGGTAEGFYSNTNLNASAYWYDYSKADSSATNDPAWTAFTSAKGSTISGNANKWNKNSPLLLFNPGNRRGTDAFGSPTTATYEQGKINLSYTLDSTTVHLNDGTTQTISTSSLSNKSKYFFITNPFTAPVKLSRIQGLTSSNVDPSFYYWKQRRNTVTNNFSPAEWQAERIFNGTALRDSNIAIPAFGTILVRLKNNNTTFTIPESAKQLSNFDYIIGGAKGISKTGQMFLDASASDVGNNGLEIKLLVNDSQEADRVLVYNEPQQSSSFTTADARKYLNQDFPNIFTLSSDGKPLALDMQDIKAELDNGKSEVAIPLAVNREANKRFSILKWEITANTTGLDVYLRNRENGSTELWSVGDIKTIAFQSNASEIRHYELVFKRNSSSTEDLTQKPNLAHRAPMELLVFPNPVDDQLQLKIINSNGEVPFHIYSITGVNVMEGSIKSEKTINTAGLDAGVYVIDAGGVKVKFVKE